MKFVLRSRKHAVDIGNAQIVVIHIHIISCDGHNEYSGQENVAFLPLLCKAESVARVNLSVFTFTPNPHNACAGREVLKHLLALGYRGGGKL